MTRRVLLGVLAIAPTIAVAAPVPKEEPEAVRITKLFGTPTDPGKDCIFKLDGKQLTIRTPGGWRCPFGGPIRDVDRLFHFPRVERTVTGDFDARVRLIRQSAPAADPKVPQVQTLAGLMVADDFAAYAIQQRRFINRRANGPAREGTRIWDVYTFASEVHAGLVGDAEPDAPVHVRLTRRGDEIRAWVSPDGKEWQEHVPKEAVSLGRRVTVGIYLTQYTTVPCEAVFEQFTVTAGEPK